jgi:hypothetical protein
VSYWVPEKYKKGGIYPAESFSPVFVLSRAQLKCYLCEKKKRLLGNTLHEILNGLLQQFGDILFGCDPN